MPAPVAGVETPRTPLTACRSFVETVGVVDDVGVEGGVATPRTPPVGDGVVGADVVVVDVGVGEFGAGVGVGEVVVGDIGVGVGEVGEVVDVGIGVGDVGVDVGEVGDVGVGVGDIGVGVGEVGVGVGLGAGQSTQKVLNLDGSCIN